MSGSLLRRRSPLLEHNYLVGTTFVLAGSLLSSKEGLHPLPSSRKLRYAYRFILGFELNQSIPFPPRMRALVLLLWLIHGIPGVFK